MTTSTQTSPSALISGTTVPDSKLANEITELVRDTESTLLFNHSSRVFYLRRTRRSASWPQIRCRATLRRRYVPRHGARISLQQRCRPL